MNEDRLQILKLVLTFVIVMTEYWAMQPYHEPVYAAFWEWVMKAAQKLAVAFGRMALNAEHNYYIAVESGL